MLAYMIFARFDTFSVIWQILAIIAVSKHLIAVITVSSGFNSSSIVQLESFGSMLIVWLLPLNTMFLSYLVTQSVKQNTYMKTLGPTSVSYSNIHLVWITTSTASAHYIDSTCSVQSLQWHAVQPLCHPSSVCKWYCVDWTVYYLQRFAIACA